MTKIELKNFKTTLAARQSELEGTFIRNREAAAIETSADALDQIQHAVERELALGTLARESSGLRETRAALRRVDDGSFGFCLDCRRGNQLEAAGRGPLARRAASPARNAPTAKAPPTRPSTSPPTPKPLEMTADGQT